MAGWIINTVRIGIEQQRITQKVGSNRFEEKALRKKRFEATNSRLEWSNGRVCHVKECCQDIYKEGGSAFLWRALLC